MENAVEKKWEMTEQLLYSVSINHGVCSAITKTSANGKLSRRHVPRQVSFTTNAPVAAEPTCPESARLSYLNISKSSKGSRLAAPPVLCTPLEGGAALPTTGAIFEKGSKENVEGATAAGWVVTGPHGDAMAAADDDMGCAAMACGANGSAMKFDVGAAAGAGDEPLPRLICPNGSERMSGWGEAAAGIGAATAAGGRAAT